MARCPFCKKSLSLSMAEKEAGGFLRILFVFYCRHCGATLGMIPADYVSEKE